MRLKWVWIVGMALGLSQTLAQLTVSIDGARGSNPWLRLKSAESPASVLTLEASQDFTNWKTIGTTHDRFWNFPEAGAQDLARRFYRIRSEARKASDDWKNEALFPEEALRSPEGQELRWVKFAIVLNDPTRVYFQDSSKFPFHYEFATQRLTPFAGMDRATFDAVSLHRANQQVALGTILYPPGTVSGELGVQFVGLDSYTPQEISQWFELVKASVFAGGGAGVYYMPVFEQSEMARTNAAEFAARNIPIASIERWLPQNHVYSPGWALGRMKYFPAGQIAAAFADGRLRPEDILLTDGVPAETPVVAGIISLTPSTPNSHTAILARSFGIPFVHLPFAEDQARVQFLAGRKILLRAMTSYWSASVKVLDVEGTLPAEVESDLLALKKAAPIQYTPKQSLGAISASTDNLGPADIRFFGGKAANYGLLRDAIPENCPIAISFSFDLWDAFMDQPMAGGGTLRQRIAARLAPYTSYPPNIPALKTDLAAIRDLIRKNAAFTAAQKSAIISALSPFNPNRNIRFRSSTNVEDSEGFTGAGLYDSYSGCLLDDLDADNNGPCACDPEENEERGVFRALQRVYASFYNDNAFLERLRHGVKENEVGMGVLVHHSFPDEVELANGVATIQFNLQFSTNLTGDLVTQVGAESVTNPDGGSIPEVVRLTMFNTFHDLALTRRSSLVPLGAYVMNWQSEYVGFANLFAKIGARYREAVNRADFQLDFEYKKDVNLGLVVKQVREIPKPPGEGETTTFLINEPTTFCVFQGERGDVFANHRLKSIWSLNTANMRLVSANLSQGLYRESSVQYLNQRALEILSGPMSGWPNAANSEDAITNTWTTGSGADRRDWRMETTFRRTASGAEPPIFTQQDSQISVTVTYPRPMPTLDYNGTLTTTTEDVVMLWPCPESKPGDILREHRFTTKSGVTIETKYYWPPTPAGAVAGYTAPVVRFAQTKISGLTTMPITLSNYYSQTYHPFHHNFAEEFIFEPRLDPNVSEADVAALEAANVRLIYVRDGFGGSPTVKAMNATDAFRDL